MCLRVCRVCPLASVNACVLFSAWLPSALAISLSLPWEKCFWLCVRSQIAANAAVESLGFEAMKMTSGCDSPWTQQGRIFPFRGVGNAVIVIASFLRTLGPKRHCHDSEFRLEDGGKGKKRRRAGLRYYNEATTQTVKRETEASEPLMREFHICPKR